MPPFASILVTQRENPKKFIDLNFKQSQPNVLFYLTILNLTLFLMEDAPKLKEDENDIQVISLIESKKHSNLCKNYIMKWIS